MIHQPAVRTLETIANTLVGLGKYKSSTDALRAMAIDQVNRKIAHYDRRVKRFEKKHRASFEKFGKRLQHRATIQLEDEWMEWEAALEMLAEWRKTKKALEN
jgi:hypothetical protein